MAPCPTHPESEAIGTCHRCGSFYCQPEQVEVDGFRYCGECGARPDVDWLGQHYRKLEGTRSGLAWFLFLLGSTVAAAAIAALFNAENWGDRAILGAVLFMALAAASVMSGKQWSLWAFLLSGPVVGVLAFFATGQPWALAIGLPVLVLSGTTWTDVRTRVFFRKPVAREALYKHFHREGSNPLAVQASRLSLLGLFVPGLCLVSLVMGIVAVARVDTKVIPPVGNLSAAVGAIIFSLFASMIWGISLAGRFF